MEYHLETFATWLREDMALSDDIKIVIDRAAIPTERKRRPTTRWDHLAKRQSFIMPKMPSRRGLGDKIEEDTATESCPVPTRMMKETSLCLPRGGAGSRLGVDGDKNTGRPGMGVKQTSLSSLPRQTSFKNLTEDEQMEMPRLLKQSSFKSLPRELCDANQTIGSRPCMNKQNSFSLPHRPSQPYRRCVLSGEPEQNHDSNSKSDATTDTLSSMPRLVKQTLFTVARLSSCGLLIGDDEKEGNGIDRRRQMAKQKSFTMPKRPIRTFDSEEDQDERTTTLSCMARLVKKTSFTVARHSSLRVLIDDDEKGTNGSDRRQHMIKQNSFTTPKRPTRTFDSEDELDGSSTHNSDNTDESQSTSTSDVAIVIGTKSGSASISLRLPTRQHLRQHRQSKAVECNVESSE
jgi:hypothetical protein